MPSFTNIVRSLRDKIPVLLNTTDLGSYLENLERRKEEEVSNVKGKGKTIPLQAWTGSEDSRRLRLPDFKTIGT
jgi:hypothetical protein